MLDVEEPLPAAVVVPLLSVLCVPTEGLPAERGFTVPSERVLPVEEGVCRVVVVDSDVRVVGVVLRKEDVLPVRTAFS